MCPDLVGKVWKKRGDQESRINDGRIEREFTIGEQVLIPQLRCACSRAHTVTLCYLEWAEKYIIHKLNF